MKYTKQDILEKAVKGEFYYKVSIDRELNISTPIEEDYTGNLTISRDTINELVGAVNAIHQTELDVKYGSPFGNQTCKWN